MPVKHKIPGEFATDLERWLYKFRKEHPHPEKKQSIPGFDSKEYRRKVQYFAFLTMVRASCREGSKFDKNRILNEWWNFAFIKPFPKEGGSLLELTEKIRHKIWEDQYDEPAEADPYMLRNSQDFQGAKNCHIPKLQTEEALMAIKSKTKSKTKTKAKPEGKAKSAKESKKAPRKEPKDRKLDKSGQSRLMCVELLMEKKYSDEEIVEKITEELDYPYSVKRVARIRTGINDGKREKQGIPAPNPPLEPIEKGGESAKSKSAKTKSAPKTKAKTKTKTKKTRSKS